MSSHPVHAGEFPRDNYSYLMAPEMPPQLYDGASSESSASSPLNTTGLDVIYGANGFLGYQGIPFQFALEDGVPAPGMIPVELDIEGLYEDHDRRRKKPENGDRYLHSQVHSRRRAQNRASQRAFRDRKEKHMKELESRLSELEGRHTDLTQSYEVLQLEYSNAKQEVERLTKKNERLEGSYLAAPDGVGLDVGVCPPPVYDIPDFYYEPQGHLGGR